jgi:hypothetical protein
MDMADIYYVSFGGGVNSVAMVLWMLDNKYALERILKRYASAWIKLVRYDAEKEKS